MISDAFQITCERTERTVRVNVSGELDLVSSQELRDHLSAQLADHTQIVVLDVAEVSFLDLSGLHALLDAATQGGDRFCVIPCPLLLHLLDIADLHDHLPIIHTDSHPRDRPDQRPVAVASRATRAPEAKRSRIGRR